MEKVKVVVRYSGGKLIKGFTQDFFPTKKLLHLTAVDNPCAGTIEVSIADLKAIFMVGDFLRDTLRIKRERSILKEKSPLVKKWK